MERENLACDDQRLSSRSGDSSARTYGTGRKVNLIRTAHRAIILCLDFLEETRGQKEGVDLVRSHAVGRTD
jgi:hypothetical protein